MMARPIGAMIASHGYFHSILERNMMPCVMIIGNLVMGKQINMAITNAIGNASKKESRSV